MASSSEEQRKEPEKEDESEAATVAAAATAAEEERPSEVFYRTKVVQFLGRSTPIILQNDNGPCPLLAICNVLLLRNNISLSLDTSEVSQQKLLSLVAERLLDSNSNTEGKDEGYVKNQQKNISDAIEVLPKLAKGIDVNVLFRRINDFEFTSECAIFDLLDIGLYHGWIVDPQDAETAEAIGLKSYNALVADLVALDTRNTEGEDKSIEEDCVDFAAATTAALGIPSPCLSRGVSFDEPPVTSPGGQRGRRGDLEEEEELMRILNLSKDEVSMPVIDSLSLDAYRSNISASAEESTPFKTSGSGVIAEAFEGQTNDRTEMSNRSELLSHEINRSNDHVDDVILSEVILRERDTSSLKAATGNNLGQSSVEGSGDIPVSNNSTEIIRPDVLIQQQTLQCLSPDTNDSAVDYAHKGLVDGVGEDQSISQTFVQENYSLQNFRSIDNQSNDSSAIFACQAAPADLHSCDGRQELVEVPQGVSLSLEGSEPLYEGEECMLDPKLPIYENREPIYEGEMIFADQANKGVEEISRVCSKDEATQKQWQLVRTFLKNSASQLTIYGLFCLQEGLKERELCVFFRNNHFSTMFKFKDELYLLATDQGYINQPDLVWEKLNEVNGDTVFMTGNFMEFKAENQVNDSWSERNAMTDYLTMEGSTPDNSTLNSDLQLALALQQEFDQQPQSQPQQGSQQSSGIGRSRLVTGPQVRNGPSSSSKQDSKSKDKCIVM